MKKILALILAAMMLLSLVACGNTNETETQTETETEPETTGNEGWTPPAGA